MPPDSTATDSPWPDSCDSSDASTDVIRSTMALVAVNDGTGTFAAAAAAIDVGGITDIGRPLDPVLADFDEDGNSDLAVGGSHGRSPLCSPTARAASRRPGTAPWS